MNILLLNWKDIKNPSSGGAEVLTHEMAKRFVKAGHSVTMFVSEFPDGKKKELIDEITIIRSGKPDLRALQNSVHFRAYRYYKKSVKGSIDVIIDEVHGMPFFSALYAKEKVVALICEVANDIWFKMFPFPWNIIGLVLERISLLLYRKRQILTISDSTKADLIKSGIPKKNITVLPMGITRVSVTNSKKQKSPTLIFVARLNKMKGIEDAIKAVALVSEKISNLTLWIVGKGEETYVDSLKQLVKDYNLTKKIKFWNYVSQEKKFSLMAAAHAIVVPSVREGFGLIVPEAGSVGTPAIVYDVPGLRDIVKHNGNGLKISPDAESLANGIETIFTNKKRFLALCKTARKESDRYSWDNTAAVALQVLKK